MSSVSDAAGPRSFESLFGAMAEEPNARRAREDCDVAQALRILERRSRVPGMLLTAPDAVGDFFRLPLGAESREHFEVAFLDTQHRLIAVERLFSGTIDGSSVYPRIVVQRALALNAAAVFFAHNHPSGYAEPSEADRSMTSRLQSVLRVMEVRVLDHFVVTAWEAASMAALGML